MGMYGNPLRKISLAAICVSAALTGCSFDRATSPLIRTRVRSYGSTSRVMSEAEIQDFLRRLAQRSNPAFLKSVPPRPSFTEDCCSDPPAGTQAILYVTSGSLVEGTTGDVVGGGHVNAGNAYVSIGGISQLQQGTQIPDRHEDEGCSGINSCQWGRHWDVDCTLDSFSVTGYTQGSATWLTAHAGPLDTSSGHTCSPSGSSPYYNDSGAGGGSQCEQYLVEESDDGGPWYQVGTYYQCGG
jgi:hypothetical protein